LKRIPWDEVLEKLIVVLVVQKLPTIYETKKFHFCILGYGTVSHVDHHSGDMQSFA
jgi:hypothetical protein